MRACYWGRVFDEGCGGGAVEGWGLECGCGSGGTVVFGSLLACDLTIAET